MFQQLKNIDTAFRHIRLFSIIFLVACVSVCGYTVHKSFSLINASQARIYILSNGKAIEAWAEDRKDNIPVEARDHVSVFHHRFFTLHPDDKAIQATITEALYMADESAKRQYDNLKENRYYGNLIAGNISQTIKPDSITIDLNVYPFHFSYYATQKIIRATSVVTRSLITEGYLRNIARSDRTPHGFLIERWTITENRDIKTENR
jgi:conjugative transposon TraK protein